MMADTHKRVDPMTDELRSEEEAATSWHTHSITDYEEFLEPVDLDAALKLSDLRVRPFKAVA